MNNMGITVFFDGLCPLCSREIEHYKRQNGADKILFKDITEPSFHPQAEGVDPVLVHKVMHVKRTNGSMALGLDAFIEIWKNLPSFTWMARTAEIRPIHFKKTGVRENRMREVGYPALDASEDLGFERAEVAIENVVVLRMHSHGDTRQRSGEPT